MLFPPWIRIHAAVAVPSPAIAIRGPWTVPAGAETRVDGPNAPPGELLAVRMTESAPDLVDPDRRGAAVGARPRRPARTSPFPVC